ncbi:MAG: ArsR/SmtB family transcription factor [Deinococcales bacterium]
MESDFLTYHTTIAENSVNLVVTPCVAIEFAYAHFSLTRDQKAPALPWHARLYAQNSDLRKNLQEFWQDDECSLDLLHLIANFGYTFDHTLDRFLDNLEHHLPEFLSQVRQRQAELELAKKKKEESQYAALIMRLERLLDNSTRAAYVVLLRQLWAFIEPIWEQEGRTASRVACDQFLEKYAQQQDILLALPTHHFMQLESSRQHIKMALAQNSVVVIPLYFAYGGGFSFDAKQQHLLAFGIRSEDYHQDQKDQSAQIAQQLKALADPTRLLLLTLLFRYQHFEMSVSDFAEQLGVTQPTVSGHLKLLRDVGLVQLEKKGNKSLYRFEHTILQNVVNDLLTQFGLSTIQTPEK